MSAIQTQQVDQKSQTMTEAGTLSEKAKPVAVTEQDLKFMNALVSYALLSCPVDGGIEMADRTTASRAMVEELKKRLESGPQTTVSDLQFMIAILDYSLFACSVDSGVDIGHGITADREKIEGLHERLKDVLKTKITTLSQSAKTTVSESQRGLQVTETDLKTLIAILDYSLSTTQNKQITLGTGKTLNRETILDLEKKLSDKTLAKKVKAANPRKDTGQTATSYPSPFNESAFWYSACRNCSHTLLNHSVMADRRCKEKGCTCRAYR